MAKNVYHVNQNNVQHVIQLMEIVMDVRQDFIRAVMDVHRVQ